MDKTQEVFIGKKLHPIKSFYSHQDEISATVELEAAPFGNWLVRTADKQYPFPLPHILKQTRQQLSDYIHKYGVDESVRKLLDIGYEANPQNRNLSPQTPDQVVADNIMWPEEVTDEELIAMARVHVHNFQQVQEKFRRILPKLKEVFKRKIGKMYPQANENIELLDRNSILVIDNLNIRVQEALGTYKVYDKSIGLSEIALASNVEGTFTHEALHAIAGKTIFQEPAEFPDFTNLVVQRSGLAFQMQDWSNSFRWLNEAATEKLTRSLVKGRESAYPEEEQLLDQLSLSGKSPLPVEIFYDAYFENYDPLLFRGQRIPKWKALIKAINEAYEPRFLVELGRLVENEGVQTGIDYVKKVGAKAKAAKQQPL